MGHLTPIDVAWLAGLFEGEGCLSRHSHRKCWVMRIKMTDRDVVERVHGLLGGKLMYLDTSKIKAHYKPSWTWHEGRQKQIRDIVLLLRPHLGQRRAAKCDEFLEYFHAGFESCGDRARRMWKDPVLRAKVSAKRKAMWADPEWRVLQIERMRRGMKPKSIDQAG